MIHQHISKFSEISYAEFEPSSYEDKLRKIFTSIYLSRLNIDYLSRIDRLEDEVYNIKQEISELKKFIVNDPLSFLSQKLSSRGNFAVLKKESFDVLFITNSEREAFNFSLKEHNSIILRLK